MPCAGVRSGRRRRAGAGEPPREELCRRSSFSLDYQITSTAAEEPALYKVLAQFGGTSGRVDGQYTPEALQLELYPQASGSSQPLTRLYISKDETLYDAGQLYRTLRSSITDNYPLAGMLIPEWNMGSYISQTQLASLLGVMIPPPVCSP